MSYGKAPVELARALQMQQVVEPLLRRRADLEIDTTVPLDRVVTAIIRHVSTARASPGTSPDTSTRPAAMRNAPTAARNPPATVPVAAARNPVSRIVNELA